jgi:hypothetical protein
MSAIGRTEKLERKDGMEGFGGSVDEFLSVNDARICRVFRIPEKSTIS